MQNQHPALSLLAKPFDRPPLPSFAIWLLSVPSLPMAVLYRDATLWEPRVGRGLPYPCPLPAPAAAVSRPRARPRHAPSPPCPAAARPALPLPAPRPGGRPHATPPVSVENTLDLKVVWEKMYHFVCLCLRSDP